MLLDIIFLLGRDKERADLDLVVVPLQEQLEDVVGAGGEVGDGVGVHLVTNVQFWEGLWKLWYQSLTIVENRIISELLFTWGIVVMIQLLDL